MRNALEKKAKKKRKTKRKRRNIWSHFFYSYSRYDIQLYAFLGLPLGIKRKKGFKLYRLLRILGFR